MCSENIGLLCSRSKSQRRFRFSVKVRVHDNFWTAEPFVTTLDVSMHYYEPQCHAESLICYHESQSHSKGANNQNITVSTESTEVLNQPRCKQSGHVLTVTPTSRSPSTQGEGEGGGRRYSPHKVTNFVNLGNCVNLSIISSNEGRFSCRHNTFLHQAIVFVYGVLPVLAFWII